MAGAEPRAGRGQRKTRVGVVVSNKMTKTIVVRVSRMVRHSKYNRVMGRTSTFKAHDETNNAGVGDLVRIMETRPISRDKRWRLVEILQRASSAPPVPGTEADAVSGAAVGAAKTIEVERNAGAEGEPS